MCICCGESKKKILAIKNGYTVVKCVNCNLIYVKDLPSYRTLKKFYSSDYFFRSSKDGIGYRNYLQDENVHRLNSCFLLDKIEKIKNIGSLLDIGCGYGFFLDEAKKRGWNAFGIDISEQACEYAKKELRLNVFNCNLSDCRFNNDYFDVITLLGTFEHLANPLDELKQINRILKKDGILLLATLNIGGIVRYFKLFQYKPPEHLFYFSKETIQKFLIRTGFYIEKIDTYYKYFSLYDLVRRTEEFFGNLLFIGSLLNKIKMPHLIIKIPTNEMLVLARKRS